MNFYSINIKNNFIFICWGGKPTFLARIRFFSGLLCVKGLHFQWQIYPHSWFPWNRRRYQWQIRQNWARLKWFEIRQGNLFEAEPEQGRLM